ncbi:Uncharacterized protein conserved in bacteria (DUF2252) [Seminavis robusta]|uniref:Uncharacterized protein conserved in bacteria (DUF2252) n=1 Tax=Seminavis robusta TaxID=568900 RepID=A0A9N8EG00_9STRA|nr:Uncharacterized protein conserved in bacteria (DUF2252) [Seminavis robusta]|eukprot:Sro943_g222840.1 Uncharacterized protein conserved in bacteria (DUF2252) (525) ;mRNA; r:34364-36275
MHSSLHLDIDTTRTSVLSLKNNALPLEGKIHHHHHHKKKEHHHPAISVANATKRCDWVVQTFTAKYFWVPEEERRRHFALATVDPNVFYRATANIFWVDYVLNGWGDRIQLETIGIHALQYDGTTPLQPKSLWTWVTGDQHLSNFGAWKNRHGDVVFGVNDFDEAAIYDFGVDVLRIAVSVCSHAHTNGLSHAQVNEVLRAFTDTYVQTVINYVGSDRELTFELTPETSSGSLKAYLTDVRDDRSSERQLEKFTDVDEHGNRHFIRNDNTRLVKVSSDMEAKIRQAFTVHRYGATLMKMGWQVKGWTDEYFQVLDIAARVGSGVGSYGVDRYYLLLKGTDNSLENWVDGNAVILDVKYEPPGAVTQVLTPEDTSWYKILFQNDAQRAIEAQRRLTSYTDPFTGWVVIDDKPFTVRQRSPWKNALDLNKLSDLDSFIDFMEQVAVSTATSHVRGTVSKSPGQFKHEIASALGHYRDRVAWGRAVQQVATDYREQVLLDFQCFRQYVDKLYPSMHLQPSIVQDSSD